MKVVVTGASGFIGSAVANRLRCAGMQVDAVSRRSVPGGRCVADYSDVAAGDIIVHLAQNSDRSAVNGQGRKAEEENLRILNALLAKGFDRFVYVSSGVLYGDTETAPRRPTDHVYAPDTYCRIKRQSELAVLSLGRAVVARLGNVYGPGMSRTNVVSTILEQVPGHGPLVVRDDAPVRDFLWYEDAAAGIEALALSDNIGIFNLGSGVGVSIKELARQTLELVEQGDRAVVAAQRSSRISTLVLDITDTLAKCSWHPRTSLSQGLGQLLKYKNHHYE